MDSLFWTWFALGLGLLGTLVFSLVLCGMCQLAWAVLRRCGLWRDSDAEGSHRRN